MPKRTRERGGANSRASSNGEEAEGSGHTPKWARSSPSESPEPFGIPDAHPAENKIINTQEMQCILPGHPPLVLATAAEFEAHYARDHTNQCIACKANLPSPWMLELHHRERHDPLVAAKRDSGEKTYRCFLQDCEKITLTAQKRRLHLIDKHGFPKNYHFMVIEWGLKGRRSLLQDIKGPPVKPKEELNADATARKDRASNTSRQKAIGAEHDVSGAGGAQKQIQQYNAPSTMPIPVPTPKQDTPPSQGDAGLDNLSKAMSSLMFVPMSVRRKNKKNSYTLPQKV